MGNIAEKNNDLGDLMPKMNVNLPIEANKENLITDIELKQSYDDIIETIKNDRHEIDSVLSNFVEMVINGGDSSPASKEALVSLLKIKSDTSDKMIKIAELKTRIYSKETNMFPKYLVAKQNNTTIVDSRRSLIDAVSKMKDDDE